MATSGKAADALPGCAGLRMPGSAGSLPGFGKLVVCVLLKSLGQQRHHRFQNVFPAGDYRYSDMASTPRF